MNMDDRMQQLVKQHQNEFKKTLRMQQDAAQNVSLENRMMELKDGLPQFVAAEAEKTLKAGEVERLGPPESRQLV